ncbi:methyl-accepting chemotaxis protein [Desulfitobacterium sp. Sab5]|uniref:methyl-accepting chemotaxis protein n=1 Tax=Desulfitobacterium nosdiversum TaxID=3375356 RepID=UPI003CFB282A
MKKHSMSIRVRITLFAASVILLVVGALSIASFWNAGKLLDSSEQETKKLVEKGIQDEFTTRLEKAKSSILSVTMNPDIQKALASRDRENLARMVQPIFDTVKKEGFSQMQFHIAPATSFYRAHSPQKFGDDLSSFRYTVVAANKENKIVSGLEEGVEGYGFRVVAPINDEGQQVGTAEYGMDFGKDFLSSLQKKNPGQYYIYVLNPDKSMVKGIKENKGLLLGTDTDQFPIPENDIEGLQNGNAKSILSDDGKKNILLVPFKDYNGEVKGYIKAVLSREGVLAQMNSLRMWVLFMGLAVLLLGVISVYMLSLLITRPIVELSHNAESLAQGNLNLTLRSKYFGELGMLASGMKKMVENTRTICSSINGAISRVENEVNEISTSTEQSSKGAEQVAASVSQVAIGAQNLAETTQNISNQANTINSKMLMFRDQMVDIGASTSEVVGRTQSGKTMMNDLAQKINEFADKVEGISQTGKTLRDQTGEIRGITNIITGISDQTNLLALNAAIEAARAGEAGRGFAVVADEVRKLAEESRQSAKHIEELIEHIAKNVESSVQATDDAASLIREQAGIGEKARLEFDEIAEGSQSVADLLNAVEAEVQEIVNMTQAIGEAVAKASDTSQDDAAAAEQIAASTEEMSAAASTIQESTRILMKHMIDLKAQSGKFVL